MLMSSNRVVCILISRRLQQKPVQEADMVLA
jgi:hypothetical protein